MQLFDTRTGETRAFVAGHTVRIYVCGITPYDATHLGHAATYVSFDVLLRRLADLGHRVRYVRNVTDVDDDILRTSRERGVDYLELAERETTRFDADLVALGCRPPDAAPRATDTVQAIVTAVDGLVAQDAAYVLDDGRVYFDIGRAPTFGSLSRLPRDEMLEQFAEKGGDPQAPGKRDALDFLLWRCGFTACATPSAPASTAPPASCGSATLGRARSRKSTGSRPPRPGSTSVGRCMKEPSPCSATARRG
jgi:L-cysteine:1D-myo-inositol 2-amino-2-deoxy-alpha-D-glucopyranoside ligase